MKKLPRGEKLEKLAEKYGITNHSSATNTGTDDSILQERLIRYLESKRNSRMWVVALLSAIASVASALAAWYAVTKDIPLQ